MAALLLTLPLGAAAQEVQPTPCDDPPCTPFLITVQGTITNCDGQGLPGVTVLIQGDFANTSAVTDSQGHYSRVVRRGTYTVTPTAAARYFFSPRSQESNGSDDADFTRFPRDNRANFDGDCKTDVSEFNRGSGLWRSINSKDGQEVTFSFGQSADVLTPGDYNGDGRTDRAVFRPGNATWYVATDTSNSFYAVQFGLTGDIPVPGDYDGDGKTDIAVFRPGPGDWYILNSSNGQVQSIHWGQSGDRPVQADYDDDGRTDIAVFRLGPGDWYILKSSDGQMQFVHWGQSGDRPVPGDYDGDGRADIAIQRPDSTGAFWILPAATGNYYAVSGFFQFPVPLGYLSPRNWY